MVLDQRFVAVLGMYVGVLFLVQCGGSGGSFVVNDAGVFNLSMDEDSTAEDYVLPTRDPDEDDSLFDDLFTDDDASSSDQIAEEGSGSSGGESSGQPGSGSSTEGTASGSGGSAQPQPSGVDALQPSGGEIQACAQAFGVPTSKIVTMGSKSVLSSSDIVAIKVTGNTQKVTLNIFGNQDQKLLGICAFTAGNKPSFTLNSNIQVGRLYYIGRGNQSEGIAHIFSGGVLESLFVHLRGNQPSFNIKGSGTYPCQHSNLGGNSPQFLCE